jgi:hypothetical protein
MVEKTRQEKCSRKSEGEKSRKKTCGRKIVAAKPWQHNGTRRKRYGFHMCSVEYMNLVEGLPCKSVRFPLGSLGLVVELI